MDGRRMPFLVKEVYDFFIAHVAGSAGIDAGTARTYVDEYIGAMATVSRSLLGGDVKNLEEAEKNRVLLYNDVQPYFESAISAYPIELYVEIRAFLQSGLEKARAKNDEYAISSMERKILLAKDPKNILKNFFHIDLTE